MVLRDTYAYRQTHSSNLIRHLSNTQYRIHAFTHLNRQADSPLRLYSFHLSIKTNWVILYGNDDSCFFALHCLSYCVLDAWLVLMHLLPLPLEMGRVSDTYINIKPTTLLLLLQWALKAIELVTLFWYMCGYFSAASLKDVEGYLNTNISQNYGNGNGIE